MAKKKYLVVHPKHAMNVKLDGQEESKMQNVPKGTVVNIEAAHAISALASGKLKLHTGKGKTAEGAESESKSKDDKDKD